MSKSSANMDKPGDVVEKVLRRAEVARVSDSEAVFPHRSRVS
jgi:hypothetical protein